MADRVPTGEVTEAMLEAGYSAWRETNAFTDAKDCVRVIYLAMRKAATPAPTYRMNADEHDAMHRALLDSVTIRSTIPRATPEQDGLVERLKGRAAFCRDRGEVKTPELLESAAAQIAELRRERDEAQRRDERVREAMFVLSDRLNLIGALDSDNVHAAYEKVVAALTNNGGEK